MSGKRKPAETRTPKGQDDKARRESDRRESDRKEDADEELDRELEDSFPASDPPSLTQDPKS